MGEFNPTVFCGDAVSLMDSALISYTLWNYKTTSYKDSDWGLYNKSLAINDIAAMASSEEAKNKILAESGQKYRRSKIFRRRSSMSCTKSCGQRKISQPLHISLTTNGRYFRLSLFGCYRSIKALVKIK